MGKKSGLFYGWWIVLVAFLSIGITYGTKGAFGVIQLSMLKDLGWTRAEVAGALSANMFIYAIVVSFAGRIMDKVGVRNTLVFGGFLMGLSYYSLTIIKTPVQFYLCYGVFLGVAGTCMGMVPGPTAVSRWFVKKRGLALAIALAASPLGSAIFTVLSKNWLNTIGWRGTFRIMAIMSWVLVIVPAILLMKNKPEDIGLHPDGEVAEITSQNPASALNYVDEEDWTLTKVLTSPKAWALFLAYFFMAGNGWAQAVHQVPHLVNNGISKGTATNALAANMFLNVISMLAWPAISDYIERKKALIIALVLQIVGGIILINSTSVGITYMFVFVSGLSYTGCYGLFSALAADLFGRKGLGTVNGVMATFGSLGAAVAVYLGGYVYDIIKSYNIIWYAGIIGLILAIVLTIGLGRLINAKKSTSTSV
ncbi:MFS transporter [Clostridium sp. DJ247]|uniref:MFS transporter n=1 Tax=Clostridium sp. DJ247 TaxID=2726188 RepID=UPI001626E3FF|nr:MFS transporter [Clostridium sp. DJ247]MBC2581929.1 MFS transporter [Clostridium sp. DJ247]